MTSVVTFAPHASQPESCKHIYLGTKIKEKPVIHAPIRSIYLRRCHISMSNEFSAMATRSTPSAHPSLQISICFFVLCEDCMKVRSIRRR